MAEDFSGFMDHELAEELEDRGYVVASPSIWEARSEFVSAAKQWRNATESRLKFLDSRGEAAKSMLKADRDLIEALERVAPSTTEGTEE